MTKIRINPLPGKNTDAIIFDLGGVLINLDVTRSIDAFMNIGFTGIEEQLSKIMGRETPETGQNLFHLFEKGEIESDLFREKIRELSRVPMRDEDIDRAWTAMLMDMHEENIALVGKLRSSYRLFLLSNTNEIHIESLKVSKDKGKKFNRLIRLFEKVYFSHEVKMRKPDTDIFNYVIDDAGLKAETSLFIDDSLPNIEAAKASGLMAHHHEKNTGLEQIFDLS